MFCSNCGKEIDENSKFCNTCGTPTSKEEKTVEKNEKQTERKNVYDGNVHKCPNCGEQINAFDLKCPSCGFEIRDRNTSNSLREFYSKLERIESTRENKKIGSIFSQALAGDNLSKTDEQKISLIRNFIIPNTKEDLYEFLILSKSNIEIDLYENTQLKSARLAVSDAWKAKFEQAYHKAKLLFKDDERMKEIQALYDETNKSITNAKWKIWKMLGIIYGVLFGIIAICIILGAISGESNNESDFDSQDTYNNAIEETVNIETNEESENEIIEEANNDSITPVEFEDNIIVIPNEYLKIKDVGYTITGNYLTCVVTITNPNTQKAIEYPSFRVTAYNKDGKILGSEERVLSILYPTQDMIDEGTLIEISEEPEKIEIVMNEPEEYNIILASGLEHPIYKKMICQNISVNSEKITGEVYNPNDYKIESAKITVIFRNSNNKIVSSEICFVDNIPANGKIPFDISLASDAKITDKIEVYADLW